MAGESDTRRKGGWWSSLVGTDAALQAARVEAEAVFKSFQAEIARLEDELERARGDLSARDERIEGMDAELRHTRAAATQQQQTASELRAQLATSEGQLRALRDTNEAQKRQLEARDADAIVANDARAALDQELSRCKARCDSLARELAAANEKIERAAAELIEARRASERDKSAFAAREQQSITREQQATARATEAARAITALEADVNTSAIELAKERDRTRVAQGELDKSRARITELERAKSDLERANAAASKSSDELLQSKMKLEGNIAAIDKQLDEERAKRARAEGELQRARAEADGSRAELATTRAAKTELEALAAKLGQQCADEKRAHDATKAHLGGALKAVLGEKSALALALVPREP